MHICIYKKLVLNLCKFLEHGAASHSTADEEFERKRLFDQNGFNAHLSDKIAMNRSVADIRHKE